MKHPLRKIRESGANPVNAQACHGLTNRPDRFDAYIERREADEREKKRQDERCAKDYRTQYRDLLRQLQWWLTSYPDTGNTHLPFSIIDTRTKAVLIPCDSSTSWSATDAQPCIDRLRQAFESHPPTNQFPFTILDSVSGVELATPKTLLHKNAIYIFRCPLGDNFRKSVKDVIQRQRV